MIYVNKLILIFYFLFLFSCSSNPHQKITNGEKMIDVYRSNSSFENEAKGYYPNSNGDLVGYTRTEKNELDSLFPKVPNPTIYLYSFPHISESGLPIPGYTTEFPLYSKSTNYSLPGEYKDE